MRTEDRLVAAVAGFGVVGVVAGALLDGRAASLATAAGSIALVATVCLVVQRAARQVHRSQVRIEQQAQAHHKRASEWNFRLTEAVGARRGSSRSAAPVRVLERGNVGDGGKRHKHAAELVASQVFDAELYGALVGHEFASPGEAASHYLSVNAGKGFMPSPLIDGDRLPDEARVALQRGDVKPLLTYLRSEDALTGELSPLFDPRIIDVSVEAAAAHPGGVVGAFLSSADGSKTLPVAPESALHGATLDGVRDLLLAHAREFYASGPPELPRTESVWDLDGERRWLNAIDSSQSTEQAMVSVIMPVKDRASVIGDAIASVVAQTHRNWELIVIDDGSSDSTVEVVRAFAEGDPRISVRAANGHGVSAARNTGLDAARGGYVAFLDSDNQWAAHFLETMLRAMTRDHVGAAYSAVSIEDGAGTQYRAFQGTPEQLLFRNHIDLNVLVVRADIADGVRFDESLRRWVDHDYAIKIAARTNPVLLPFIGCFYDHSAETDDRITVRESEHWQWVALSRHWVRWEDAREPVPGRVSVVVPTYNDSAMTIPAVLSVLADATASGLDIEVVIIDNGSRIEVGQEILKNVGAMEGVVYRRLPRNLNFATGCNVGAVLATGEFVLFLNNDTLMRGGVLRRLVERLDDPQVLGAQPLLVFEDETIQTAGTVFTAADALPSHFLTGHPPADALTIGSTPFTAVTAAALMMRTAQVRQLQGFDALFVNGLEDVDLCLRASAMFKGGFAVVPDAVVTHLESQTPGRTLHQMENRRLFLARWRGRLPRPQREHYQRAGFQLAHVGSDGLDVPGPRPVIVRDPADHRARWGIHIASDPGPRGDTWGDTHFGESLRAALVSAGVSAVVHRFAQKPTRAAAFDDVALVVRGKHRVTPQPGTVNVLWIISHPEDVTVDEVRSYDLVFAASETWAHEMSVQSGVQVRTLLQATDPERFSPDGPEIASTGPLFVGGNHAGRVRGVIATATSAQVPVVVYGHGWEGILPAGTVRAEYIPNDQLAAYYRGAPIVLADHWDDMAEHGFVQNRVFDAVACGARVVSNDVVGLEDLFGGAARVFHAPDELVMLCAPEGQSGFASEDELVGIAAHVRKEHTFAKRAHALIDGVTYAMGSTAGAQRGRSSDRDGKQDDASA